MLALQKPKEMAVAKPRKDGKRVDVQDTYKRMIAKYPKTFEYLAK